MRKDISPVPMSFFVASIIGFLVSVLWLPGFWAEHIGEASAKQYPVAFALAFLLMFFSSMRSMRYANPDYQLKARPKRK